jgi:hypothetical protein
MTTDARRPALLCRGLLAALDASEGRRRRRKRDTTPDAIGLEIKRALIESAIREDPEPDEFEGWLLAQCVAAYGTASVGATRMMALDLLAEWRMALAAPDFMAWLERGAPSDDATDGDRATLDGRKPSARPPAA